METSVTHVYKAINLITAEMAAEGISKTRKNQQQGFMFRGIDDVYASLAPKLAKHGLCMLPRIISRESSERQTAKGGVLLYTVLHVEYDLVSAIDGSKHTVSVVGEAMDSGDKSSSKAMSAAYKYAAFQAFAIPTEADNDADAHTHEVSPLVLDGLREAAMQGMGQLQRAYENNKKTPGFAALWKTHSESLKAAAAEADELNTETEPA